MSAQDSVQNAQTMIGQLQMQYRDSDPKFWALGVAWEPLRFAWYVLDGDTCTHSHSHSASLRGLSCVGAVRCFGAAQDKLRLLEDAIADYQRRSKR